MQLTLDELKNKNDEVIESQGIKVVYHLDIKEHLKDSMIDYENSWYKRGFVIRGSQLSSC